MKKITKIIKQDITETIKVGEKEIETTLYVADDGEEYRYKSDCERHNVYIKRKEFINTIPNEKLGLELDYIYNWYYFKSKYELLEFMKIACYNHKDKEFANRINYPQWVGVSFHDGGDYQDDYYYYSLEEIFSEVSKLRDHLNNII